MNSDNQIIPIVEDDQGEEWRDPLDEWDLKKLTRGEKKLRKKHYDKISSRHSRKIK